MTAKHIAVIFAAGIGERMEYSSKPKQFLEFQGKPVLAYTMEHFQQHREIDGIVLVALEGWLDYCWKMAAAWRLDKLVAVVPGGETSQESIRMGLEKTREVYGEDVVVLIHDGVRPLIDEETISKCIRSVREYGSAITVSQQMETIMFNGQPGQAYNAADESTYCSISDMAQKVAANGISLRFKLENKTEHGYPGPVYMDLDGVPSAVARMASRRSEQLLGFPALDV